MPYVVPASSPTRASPRSPFGPGSPTLTLSSSPPIPLSLSLSSPAPVPNFIPFPPSSSSASSSRRNGDAAPLYPSDSSTMNINMSYAFPRRTTPLLKSQSEMSPSMIGSPLSQASSSPSPPRSTPSNSPSPRLTRRSASASSAELSPLATRARHHQRSSQSEFGSFDLGRFDNNAGRGLARIPRRVALSASSSTSSVNGEIDGKDTPTKRRSRFVLGSEDSGSDAEKENREKEKKEKGMEEREARKRPVSAERVRSLACTDTAESTVTSDEGLVFEMDLAESPAATSFEKKSTLKLTKATKDESDSDCATPTPISVAKEREIDRGRKGREKVLQVSRTNEGVNGLVKQARRRSGLSGEVQISASEETSSVTFPSSSPPSPTLSTSSTATVQADQPRSFAGKRSNAGSLRIDLPKSSTSLSPPASPSPSVTATEIPSSNGEGHHAHLLLSKSNYSPPANRVAMVPIIQVASTRSPPIYHAGGALRASASTSMVPLIRKKSGEVLKSSLKRRSSSASGATREGVLGLSLSELSDLHVLSPSLSAPATPSAMDDDDVGSLPSSVQSATVKMVHFDAQLEHVKLFLAEQKPAAVSRDGSPTMDDTASGGESGTEWDAFNYGGAPGYFNQRRKRLTDGASSEEEAAVRKVLVMRVLNMPNRDAKSNSGSTLGVHTQATGVGAGKEEIPGAGEVWLEGLYLADDASCVKGTVRVRNIAFEKSVVVRFTFDGWQTTSEVSARWIQSCSPPPHCTPLSSESESKSETPATSSSLTTTPTNEERPKYDRFEFAIRLSDLLLRIDEKTLVLAVRYCSAGKEMWDNNNGQNYRAVFEKRVPGKNALTLVGTAVVTPGSGSGSTKPGKDGKDGGGRDNALGLSLQGALERIASGAKGGGARDSENASSLGSGSTPTKKNSDSLASRYDLGASLKNRAAWRPSPAATWISPSQQSTSAFVFPSGQTNGRSTVPWPAKKSASYIDGLPQTWGNVKFPMFATHKVNFAASAQGLARGSPRDPDLDNLDDEALANYQKRALGMSNSNMELRNATLGPSFRRRESNMSTGSNVSNASFGNSEALGRGEHVRNHHRSYFDVWAANYTGGNGKARLTPPGFPHRSLSDAELTAALGSQASSRAGTPVSEFPIGTVSPGRFRSFPPLTGSPSSPGALGVHHQTVRPWGDVSAGAQMGMGHQGLGLGMDKLGQAGTGTGSEISTPSITSVSSPTMTPSPASPPDFAMLGPMVAPNFTTSPTGDGVGENGLMDSDSYSMFLNRFCFYTGRDGLLDIPSDMRRSHSASSVEEFLSSPGTLSTEAFPLIKGSAQATPTNCASPRASTPPFSRSANFESTTSTPTPASLLKSESPLSTSVHG